MKKLLYIGHSYHNKTKSTQFLQDILSTEYEIEKFDFDPYNDSFKIFSNLSGKKFDVVVIFQIMPSIKELKKYISFDKIAFFPMYDGKGDIDGKKWSEYECCNIINFSKTLHEECLKRGFSSYYIQYFPKPLSITNYGDEKSVFLWQRIKNINAGTVAKIFPTEEINKLYLHNAPDPLHSFIEPPLELRNKTEITTWFDTKENLLEHIQKSAIYMAPRHLEGIGMSFLEAMAMGRCVIAPDNPTMNEYIVNGKTGYLYDFDNPKRINLKNIKQIQNNTIKYIQTGYENWEKNKLNILTWIDKKPTPNKFKKWVFYNGKQFIQNIFSIKNETRNGIKRKVIRFLGFKLSIKLKKKNNIPIVMASDDVYAPYLCTALYSLLEHTQSNINIYILDGGIKKESKQLIEKSLKNFHNFSIRYIDMSNMGLERFPNKRHYSLNTFSRYFIPQLLPNLKKVLYLDVDIIVNGDIKELYDIEIDNCALAAIPENFYKLNGKYVKEHIKPSFKNTEYYFNAGIMLLNIELFIQKNYSKTLISKTVELADKLSCVDQDVFNIVFEKNHKLIDYKYNYMPDFYNLYSKILKPEELEKLDNNAIIYHYTAGKPWKKDEKEVRKSDLFEKTYNKTLFSKIKS